jgi:hypothetical protein
MINNPKDLTIEQIIEAEKTNKGQFLNDKKQFFIYNNAIYKKYHDKFVLLTPTENVFKGKY